MVGTLRFAHPTHFRLDASQPLSDDVIPGCAARRRPQMRNCASGNLEIPGSMLTHRPGMTSHLNDCYGSGR